MKNIQKLKKNFVINTNFVEKTSFNEPVYIIDSTKENITVYTIKNKNIVTTKTIKIDEKLNSKTFITVKDFLKKCTLDNTEFKIEKVNNGDVYIRVAYFNDLSLFFRIGKTNKFILTNIKAYKFYPTKNNTYQALNNIETLSDFEKDKIARYLKNFKNIKRDLMFSLNKSLEALKKSCKPS
ncbi:MAG: hypothetical protein E7359_00210 [Clostridiales bacterium]|nr:hypothetical protein [Clostridiales bacterium]